MGLFSLLGKKAPKAIGGVTKAEIEATAEADRAAAQASWDQSRKRTTTDIQKVTDRSGALYTFGGPKRDNFRIIIDSPSEGSDLFPVSFSKSNGWDRVIRGESIHSPTGESSIGEARSVFRGLEDALKYDAEKMGRSGYTAVGQTAEQRKLYDFLFDRIEPPSGYERVRDGPNIGWRRNGDPLTSAAEWQPFNANVTPASNLASQASWDKLSNLPLSEKQYTGFTSPASLGPEIAAKARPGKFMGMGDWKDDAKKALLLGGGLGAAATLGAPNDADAAIPRGKAVAKGIAETLKMPQAWTKAWPEGEDVAKKNWDYWVDSQINSQLDSLAGDADRVAKDRADRWYYQAKEARDKGWSPEWLRDAEYDLHRALRDHVGFYAEPETPKTGGSYKNLEEAFGDFFASDVLPQGKNLYHLKGPQAVKDMLAVTPEDDLFRTIKMNSLYLNHPDQYGWNPSADEMRSFLYNQIEGEAKGKPSDFTHYGMAAPLVAEHMSAAPTRSEELTQASANFGLPDISRPKDVFDPTAFGPLAMAKQGATQLANLPQYLRTRTDDPAKLFGDALETLDPIGLYGLASDWYDKNRYNPQAGEEALAFLHRPILPEPKRKGLMKRVPQ